MCDGLQSREEFSECDSLAILALTRLTFVSLIWLSKKPRNVYINFVVVVLILTGTAVNFGSLPSS